MILPVGMKVRPTIPGAVVRFPLDPNRRLKDEGEEVPETGEDSLHWHRLIHSKDVTRIDGEQASETPTGREPTTPLTTR